MGGPLALDQVLDLNKNNKGTSMNNNNDDDPSKRQARQAKGQCPSCGQPLYRLEPIDDEACCLLRCFGKVVVVETENGDNTKQQVMVKKIPLTIPRLVERGQCLNCLNGSRSSRDSNTVDTLDSQGPNVAFPTVVMQDRGQSTSTTKEEQQGIPTLVGMSSSLWFSDGTGEPKTKKDVTLKNAPTTRKVPPRNIPAGTAVYDGAYNEYGEKHGHGIMYWSNGDVYQGEFFGDVRQGHGTLTFAPPPNQPNRADGGEYVGDWVNNQMHGSGTRRYPNGDVYMGTYVHGKRQGEGRFYYANGDLHWGQWHNNHMHGPGRYYYASGQRFEGTFLHSKRNGQGKLQRTDGTLEIFQYINDQRVGQGVRWAADRTKAWRLWMPSNQGRTGQQGCTAAALEKRSISIAEAVGLVSEIELAAATYQEDLEQIMLN